MYNGSIIRSWFIQLIAKGYNEKSGFDKVPSFIEDTGEVNWLVGDELRMEVPVQVIAQSVMQLFASIDNIYMADKAISLMRNGFGGHPLGPNKGMQLERQRGKIENLESSSLYKSSGEPGHLPNRQEA